MTRRASVGNPVVWGKHVFTRKGKNAAGDKIDNGVSHKFDLQMFLTVRDILSDGQFAFSNILLYLESDCEKQKLQCLFLNAMYYK